MSRGKITEQELAPSVRAKLENIPADTGAALQAVSNALVHYGEASGTNVKSMTITSFTGDLLPGLGLTFKNTTANTDAVMLNVNGKGAKSIVKNGGTPLASGNLKAGGVYTVRYDGTNFILQGEGGSGNATPTDVVAGKTFTNDNGEQVGLGDPNLVPSNIKKGTTIYGVTGDSLMYESGRVMFGPGTINTSEMPLLIAKNGVARTVLNESVSFMMTNDTVNEEAIYMYVRIDSTTGVLKKIVPSNTSLQDEVVWSITIKTTSSPRIISDQNGFLYVYYKDQVTQEVKLTKVSLSGSVEWTKTNTVLTEIFGKSYIDFDEAENMYVAFSNNTSSLIENLVKYDSNFNKQWGRTLNLWMRDISVSHDGTIFLKYFRNYQEYYYSQGFEIAGYSTLGTPIWTNFSGATYDGYAYYEFLLSHYLDKKTKHLYCGYRNDYNFQVEKFNLSTGSKMATWSRSALTNRTHLHVDYIAPGPNGNILLGQGSYKEIALISRINTSVVVKGILIPVGSAVDGLAYRTPSWLPKSEYFYFSSGNAWYKVSNRDLYKLP